ncbi:MAG: hypothetical protein ABSG46_17750 [Candidatus Binataceae bacterium]|jgi:hypothetical protein
MLYATDALGYSRFFLEKRVKLGARGGRRWSRTNGCGSGPRIGSSYRFSRPEEIAEIKASLIDYTGRLRLTALIIVIGRVKVAVKTHVNCPVAGRAIVTEAYAFARINRMLAVMAVHSRESILLR